MAILKATYITSRPCMAILTATYTNNNINKRTLRLTSKNRDASSHTQRRQLDIGRDVQHTHTHTHIHTKTHTHTHTHEDRQAQTSLPRQHVLTVTFMSPKQDRFKLKRMNPRDGKWLSRSNQTRQTHTHTQRAPIIVTKGHCLFCSSY
jgi:hypothetical protein